MAHFLCPQFNNHSLWASWQMFTWYFLWLQLIPSFLVINSALLSSKQRPANFLWVMTLHFPLFPHYSSLGFSRLLFSALAWRYLIILPLVHSNLWTNKCSEPFFSFWETNWKVTQMCCPSYISNKHQRSWERASNLQGHLECQLSILEFE